ncbi:DUF4185 domain-containing protein [Mangrovibacterium diazotrophicum]|uniref:DUF4185 domain-containing protein n=1 Tax=Mangrovibacterium diazotrophicum TaxID=1261403 RepID=A0A419VYL2_9BACT|nr:DUF4185 domain-containing protein [Mangrovibacterium diazotrophicum]RKD88302.1 hypothetical protein BC643_3447 [Mangrovibacterium diazotrophicum]
MMKRKIMAVLVILVHAYACTNTEKIPVDVAFKLESLTRPEGRGDNWCITWAADDSQITSMDDGNWLQDERKSYHNNLYRIRGGKDDFSRDAIPGYPKFSEEGEGWFGYGVCAVDGTLYSAVSRTPRERWGIPFKGFKLLKSEDNGQSWYRINKAGEARKVDPWDEDAKEADSAEDMFFLEEYGDTVNGRFVHPFTFCSFAQQGKNHSASTDGYIYIYGPGLRSHQLLMARVKSNDIDSRSNWEFFAGWNGDEAQWTGEFEKAKPAFEFPEKNDAGEYFGWYSWLPSVVWNEGLGLYIMVNGGTYAGTGYAPNKEDYFKSPMHSKSGSLGFWYAKTPYGPWTQFYYNDSWTADDPNNLTYQPKLSPKWISKDGTHMVLIWSDAMRNEEGKMHEMNYRWNQMDIEIKLAGEHEN